ncbi:MAG: glutamate--cysteine ligase, partial [Gammaproteobacteria bacterium]|nr:glutamate--cysteine ligase [Gammaproteobacteria bacterium]
MGKEVSNSRFSRQDFKAFGNRLDEETRLLESWFRDHRFENAPAQVGFELEAWLVDHDQRPAPINEVFLERLANNLVVPELARFNVEINGTPQPLSGKAFSKLSDELETTWDNCVRAAGELDAQMAMIGHLPTVLAEDLTLSHMSQLARFRALNEQVLRLRQGNPLTINIQGREHLRTAHFDVMLEAAATSFQIHVQVTQAQSVRFYNAAQILSAPMVAACANSPFLFGKELWEETRIPLFEQAIGLQTAEDGHPCQRVTFGTDYVRDSLFECFEENIRTYPILLPANLEEAEEHLPHLRLHNGTIWRWNRPLIGFDTGGRPHLRIEHRVVPSGPTVRDCIANAAFFCGLIHELGTTSTPAEDRLDFSDAKNNFYAAARQGLDARIKWLDGE